MLQVWFKLADPRVEKNLHDSTSMRNFVGIDVDAEGAPYETTVWKFGHLRHKYKTG